jgi:hypothetical protein
VRLVKLNSPSLPHRTVQNDGHSPSLHHRIVQKGGHSPSTVQNDGHSPSLQHLTVENSPVLADRTAQPHGHSPVFPYPPMPAAGHTPPIRRSPLLSQLSGQYFPAARQLSPSREAPPFSAGPLESAEQSSGPLEFAVPLSGHHGVVAFPEQRVAHFVLPCPIHQLRDQHCWHMPMPVPVPVPMTVDVSEHQVKHKKYNCSSNNSNLF